MPKVAIILVNYNGLEYLDDCLKSLSQLTYNQADYKIFFVDNASTDNSVAFVKANFPQVAILQNSQNLGFAEGNNIGLRQAIVENFDYVFLINQDTITQPDVLTQLVDLAEQNLQIAAVQPRLMLHPETAKVNSLGNVIHYLGFGYSLGNYQPFSGQLQPQPVAYASGAAVLYRASALRKVGLFDSDFFMYHEDLDLGWRLRLAGYEIMVVPSAVVYHKYQFSRSLKKYYFMERNRFICLAENYRGLTLVMIAPALLAMEIGLFIFSLKSGFWPQKLKAYVYFIHIANWRKVWQHRQAKKQYRQVPDKNIIQYFTGRIANQEVDNWILTKIANPLFNLYWQIIKKLIIW